MMSLNAFRLVFSKQPHTHTRSYRALRGLLAPVAAVALSGCSALWSPYTPVSSYEQARTQFTQQQYKRAMRALLPYAERGNADAQYAVGYMYYYGQGVPANTRLGIKWMREAASFDNAKARQALLLIRHANHAS